jgi:hypothetical protein
MKSFRRTWGILLLGFVCMVFVSCSSGGASETCRDGICIDMELEEPIMFADSTILTVTISTENDLSNIELHLNSNAADLQFSPQEQWFIVK